MFFSKRNGIYYIWYRDENGKKQKVSTHSRTKSQALDFYRTFNPSKSDIPEKVPLSRLTREVLTYVQANHSPSTFLLYQRATTLFMALVGDMPLTSLTARHYDLFKSNRMVGLSPHTANMDLRHIKSCLNFAVRWKYLSSSPFNGCKQIRIPEVPPRYYSREDFGRLIQAIRESWLKDLVCFALLTGMRRGEITNLKWSNVDIPRRMISIQSDANYRTKMGKRRVIPVNEEGVRLLLKLRSESTIEYVFSFKGRKVPGCWATEKLKSYVRMLGLDDRLNFHSLRHTTASWLAQSGVSIYHISKLLGHSSVQLTQDFYAHMEPEALREGVNLISAEFNGGKKEADDLRNSVQS
jgi:integrase